MPSIFQSSTPLHSSKKPNLSVTTIRSRGFRNRRRYLHTTQSPRRPPPPPHCHDGLISPSTCATASLTSATTASTTPRASSVSSASTTTSTTSSSARKVSPNLIYEAFPSPLSL